MKYIAYQLINAKNVKDAEKILNDTTDEDEIQLDTMDNFFADNLNCNDLFKAYNEIVLQQVKELV